MVNIREHEQEIPIYPSLKLVSAEIPKDVRNPRLGMHYSTAVVTRLRKEKDGKYYFWYFYRNYPDLNTPQRVAEALTQFHMEVYNTIILGIVDPELTDRGGSKIMKEDSNPESEVERLKRLLYI